MYFRTKITPTGKTLQLVESYRDRESRPRQRLVLSLGDADLPKRLRAGVLRGLAARLSGQVDFTTEAADRDVVRWVDDIVRRMDVRPGRQEASVGAAAVAETAEGAPSDDEASTAGASDKGRTIIDGVIADAVAHQDTVMLGPVLVGLRAWESLGMPSLLERLGLKPLHRTAVAMDVINRLVEPVSENALLGWVPTTALPELLGSVRLPGGRDGYYRACDQLLKRRTAIAAHLRQREQHHFHLDRTILLYDLTNTYFEGEALGNPQAKRGKSKEKRSDCPQVVVGMVFDKQGFELGHEVFAGNQSDAKSLVDMAIHLQSAVDAQRSILQDHRPLVIIDGGIATAANRKLFTEQGFDYLANDSRPGRKKYADYFTDESAFMAIPDRDGTAAVLVRSLPDPLAPDGVEPDTLILCKSAGRREKEYAIFSSAERRFLDDVQRLTSAIATGKRRQRTVIEKDLARILARHPRVARYYQTAIILTEKQQLAISAVRKADAYEQADGLLGCYILRTCARRCTDARDWWHLYMTLSRAEDGFRALKSHLGLRPIRHQSQDRSQAHIFVSVLAYHLLQFITFTLAKTGDHRQWSTIRRVLSTHAYTTIALPTLDGTTHRIRKPGTPDQDQALIYHHLGIDWRLLPTIHTIA